jgi:AbiU2
VTPEQQFENELEVFRTETQTAVQFFYAYLTIHAVARDRPAVHRLLNRAPLFWNTNLGALQTGSFIVLGRIFDQQSKHNIDRLLRIGQSNLGIFSKAALGARKQSADPGAAAWLSGYLRDAYVPTAKDFRYFRSLVRKHRATYEAKYRDLRHKLFAHREVSDPAAVSALFARTNVRELQRILMFLLALYDALWMLFVNGHKPVLRMRRYSVARIRKKPSARRGGSLQERLIGEIEEFLSSVASRPIGPAEGSPSRQSGAPSRPDLGVRRLPG